MKHLILFVGFLMIISCQSQQFVTTSQNMELPIKMAYKNIKIDEGYTNMLGPCEPSIAINPKNPNNMVAGSVLNNVYSTFNSGNSWSKQNLKSNLGVYGDPCIISDFDGNFYFLHLANPDGKGWASPNFLNQIVIQKSIDGGASWNLGTGIGKNVPKKQDKEWAVTHPITGQIYTTWTEFDVYGSKNPMDKSRIRFATSVDGGNTFSNAVTISDLEGDCLDNDQTTEGAVPAVDRDGNIFVSWAVNNEIHFDSSSDHGATWNKDQIISAQPGGWAQEIPTVGRCNGMPITVVDISDSPFKGNIYVNWTDQRNGTDNTDVFIIKSNDKGKTWSKTIKVNNDNTKTHQFFTWMTVDPITGFIYIVYYDRSHYKDNKTDVVLSVSKDGGESFKSYTISESPFVPSEEIFFGDYNNISAYDGIVRPIWTRYENGVLSVWTALIEFK